MNLRRKLTAPEKWQIVGMSRNHLSLRTIADLFVVNPSVVSRLLKRHRKTGMLMSANTPEDSASKPEWKTDNLFWRLHAIRFIRQEWQLDYLKKGQPTYCMHADA